MGKDFSNYHKLYSRSTQRQIDARHVDEITFGLYPNPDETGDAVPATMAMRWYPAGDEKPVPCLEVFDDAWSALAQLTDLLTLLDEHDSQSITPEQFCEILERCDFANEHSAQ